MEILGLVYLPNTVVLILAFIALAYLYYTWSFNEFAIRGVPTTKKRKPIPVLGHLYPNFFKKGLQVAHWELLKECGGKMCGYFEGRNPIYLIADLDIIKQITVKDSLTHFHNRRKDFFGGDDELLEKSVLFRSGEEWKNTRGILSPTFTASKMKQMSSFINEACDVILAKMKAIANNKESVDAKVFFGSYSLDVIASVMFGIQIDSQKNTNSLFVKYAKNALAAGYSNPVRFVCSFAPFMRPVLRWLRPIYNITFIPKESQKFFGRVVKEVIEGRRNGNAKRNDFIQLMLNTNTENLHKEGEEDSEVLNGTGNDLGTVKGNGLTDEEIVCNAVVFFLAGYETIAVALSWTFYCLAYHPDVQDRLCEEVDEVTGGQSVSYETLKEMPYLEQVWQELLRLHSPAAFFDRECVQDCELENGVNLRAGDRIFFSVFTIHHDPSNWPDPEKFDPERFSPENKKCMDPYKWLPFGMGPRNCIGMRFAIMEAKILIARSLQKFKFVPTDETVPNLNPFDHSFQTNGIHYPTDGIKIGISAR